MANRIDENERMLITQSLQRYPALSEIARKIEERDCCILVGETSKYLVDMKLEDSMNLIQFRENYIAQTDEWLQKEQPYGTPLLDRPLPSPKLYECGEAVAYWLNVSVDDLLDGVDISPSDVQVSDILKLN